MADLQDPNPKDTLELIKGNAAKHPKRKIEIGFGLLFKEDEEEKEEIKIEC